MSLKPRTKGISRAVLGQKRVSSRPFEDRFPSGGPSPIYTPEDDSFHSQGIPLQFRREVCHAHVPVRGFSESQGECDIMFDREGGERIEDLQKRTSSMLTPLSELQVLSHGFTAAAQTLSRELEDPFVMATDSIGCMLPPPESRQPSISAETAAILSRVGKTPAVEEEEKEKEGRRGGGGGGRERRKWEREWGREREEPFEESGDRDREEEILDGSLHPSVDIFASMKHIEDGWLLARLTGRALPKHLEDFSHRCHCAFKTVKSKTFTPVPNVLLKTWKLIFFVTGFADPEDISKCSFNSYLVYDESLRRIENGLKDITCKQGATKGAYCGAVVFGMQLNAISFHEPAKDPTYRIALEFDDGLLTLYSPPFRSRARKPQNRPDLDIYANGEGSAGSPSHRASGWDEESDDVSLLVDSVARDVLAMGESARLRFIRLINEKLSK